MKKFNIIVLVVCFTQFAYAQTELQNDTAEGTINVYKDNRLDLLAKKEAAFNEGNGYSLGPRSTKGFRLMLLSTTDRTAAMKLRAEILKRYPEQKVYMSYQPPYIKLRFGNFVKKEDAEKYRTEIIHIKLVTNNIYVLPETIVVKSGKDGDSTE